MEVSMLRLYIRYNCIFEDIFDKTNTIEWTLNNRMAKPNEFGMPTQKSKLFYILYLRSEERIPIAKVGVVCNTPTAKFVIYTSSFMCTWSHLPFDFTAFCGRMKYWKYHILRLVNKTI